MILLLSLSLHKTFLHSPHTTSTRLRKNLRRLGENVQVSRRKPTYSCTTYRVENHEKREKFTVRSREWYEKKWISEARIEEKKINKKFVRLNSVNFTVSRESLASICHRHGRLKFIVFNWLLTIRCKNLCVLADAAASRESGKMMMKIETKINCYSLWHWVSFVKFKFLSNRIDTCEIFKRWRHKISCHMRNISNISAI